MSFLFILKILVSMLFISLIDMYARMHLHRSYNDTIHQSNFQPLILDRIARGSTKQERDPGQGGPL